MPVQNVNNKEIIKKPIYYHCFKLSNSSYVLFDKKMDMPLVIGSLSIIKTFNLPAEAVVFYYKIHASGFFYKGPDKTIDIEGEGKRMKPPLRYGYIDDNDTIFFHHFKLSNVLSVIFGSEFNKPLMYGSNQKIQMIKNQIGKDKQIFVYKEDLAFKGSFKLWQVEAGSKT